MLKFLAVGEDRLVGEVGHAGETWNGGELRRGTRGDHKTARPDAVLAGNHALAVDKLGRGGDHLDVEPGEPFNRVIGCNGGDHRLHMVVYRAMVDGRLYRRNAKHSRRAHGVGALGGGQQRLRGHTTIVEAVAAHLVLLNEHDGHAELRRRRGDRKPAGATPDNAQIGAQLACRSGAKDRQGACPCGRRRNARPGPQRSRRLLIWLLHGTPSISSKRWE